MSKTLILRCLYLYVHNAVRLALRLFGPHGGFLPATEPILDGFSILRGTVGVLALVIIDTAYSANLGGFQDFPLIPPSLADSWVLIGAPGVIVLLALTALRCASCRPPPRTTSAAATPPAPSATATGPRSQPWPRTSPPCVVRPAHPRPGTQGHGPAAARRRHPRPPGRRRHRRPRPVQRRLDHQLHHPGTAGRPGPAPPQPP